MEKYAAERAVQKAAQEMVLDAARDIVRLKGMDLKILEEPYAELTQVEKELYDPVFGAYDIAAVNQYLERVFRPGVIYLTVNYFSINRVIFFMEADEEHPRKRLVVIGPCLSTSWEHVLEYKRNTGDLDLYDLDFLKQYYSAIPAVPDEFLTETVKILLQKIFGMENIPIETVYTDQEHRDRKLSRHEAQGNARDTYDPEQVWELQDELMHYLELGDTHNCYRILDQIDKTQPWGGTNREMRRSKVDSIITNTICREAMRRALVSPYHLEEVFEGMNTRIEQAVSGAEIQEIGSAMIRKYTLLLRNHSVKGYSSMIRRAVTYIEMNLIENLSLGEVAGAVGVSPEYLSSRFKKETGQTFIKYINDKRIQKALVYLGTTSWSIAEISEKIGILDVNYFSRIFKKKQGMTPSAYRQMLLEEKES